MPESRGTGEGAMGWGLGTFYYAVRYEVHRTKQDLVQCATGQLIFTTFTHSSRASSPFKLLIYLYFVKYDQSNKAVSR